MAEARIEFAKSALDNFRKLCPLEDDLKAVRQALLRVACNPHAGEPVPFQWEDCYLTWVDEWRIIYKTQHKEDEPEIVYVLHIDMEGIEFASAALDGFRRLSPSEDDKKAVRQALRRAVRDPHGGEPVPFQWNDCYLTWAGRWRIIYKEGNLGICVLHVDNKMF